MAVDGTKYIYTWAEYTDDMESLIQHLTYKNKSVHIVSIYRGSLGIGAHISNVLDVPLSIVKFQTYDAKDREVEFLYNAGIKSNELIIIVDDILDSGNTLNKVYEFLEKEFPITGIESFTIHGDPKTNINFPRNMYLKEKKRDGWMVYPWEI